MNLLVDTTAGVDGELIAAQASLVLARNLGGGVKGAARYEKRLRFYLKQAATGEFQPATKGPLDVEAASLVLGNTIGMPARWVRDIYTGRRGT